MTDLRALDRIDPPDLWPEILDRAMPGATTVPEPNRHRRVLLAAAVLIVLAGVAGGLVLLRTGGQDNAPADGPSPWGHRWELVRLIEDGEDIAVRPRNLGPAVLDLREVGTVEFTACATQRATTRVDGDRLEPGSGATFDEDCAPAELNLLDDVMADLISLGPTFALHGDGLTLRTSTIVAELIDMDAMSPAAAIWGRMWDLTELVHDGSSVAIPEGGTGADGARPGGSPLYLDAAEVGRVLFTGCNDGGTRAHLDGDRLVDDGSGGQTEVACADELVHIDELVFELLRAGPTVRVDGDDLTISSSETTARFVDATVAGPVLVSSGVGPCRAGLLEPVAGASVLSPGHLQPRVVAGGALTDHTGTWHWTAGDQRVEIHTPMPSVFDFVGERTENVELDNGQTALVWHSPWGAQVRVDRGLEDATDCGTYAVTVTGPVASADRDLALAFADQLLIAP